MKKSRRYQEEHQSHDAWAIPYGDLVTLLLAFFVTMYAVSSVNAGKYRVLSDALSAAFRGAPRSPQAISVGQSPADISDSLPITEVNRMFTAGMPAYMRMPLPQAAGTVRTGQPTPGSADPRDAQNNQREQYEMARNAELDGVEADVSNSLTSIATNNNVQVTRHGDNIEVQISTDILFGSGEAQLASRALVALGGLAEALKQWPNRLRVIGHTDNRPISTARFQSNWELSAARAASVVRLFGARGINAKRMAVIGYGEFAPLQPNTTPAGRNANRRVVIVILGRDSKGEV
jgi:chemotaxis protein MotB